MSMGQSENEREMPAKKASSTRLAGVLRVLAFGAVMAIPAVAFIAYGATASVGEATLTLGRDLAPLADVIHDRSQLDLNGQMMILGSTLTDAPVKTVLDRFQAHCDANPSAFDDRWKEVARDPAAHAPGAAQNPLVTMVADFGKGTSQRSEGARDGVVMCLTRGAKTGGTFAESMKAFSSDHDLGHLGKMRYVYAKKTKNGHTLVLTVLTEDSFSLDKLAPPKGTEGGGTDSASVPRPPSAQRLINAQLVGTPYGVRIYTSTESVDSVAKFYDTEMVKRGYENLATKALPAGYEMPAIQPGAHFYQHEATEVAVLVTAGSDGKTSVSICELGAAATEGKLALPQDVNP